MASPYIRDYRHYNTANTDPIVIQRPSYQPGDIILVIYNSDNWSNSRQPVLPGFTQLNPYSGTSNEPFNLRVIFYKTATANEPSSYSIDVNGAYDRTTVTIMTIANAEYNTVFNTQSYNANLGSVSKDSLVICSLTTNGTPPNPNGPYNLFVTGITGTDSRQHPIYQKAYAANQQIVSASTSASWNSTYMIYLVFTAKTVYSTPTLMPWSTNLPETGGNGSHYGAPMGSAKFKMDARITEFHIKGPSGVYVHLKNLKTGQYWSLSPTSSPYNKGRIYVLPTPIDVKSGDILAWVASGNVSLDGSAGGSSWWDGVSNQQKRPTVSNDVYDVIRTDVMTDYSDTAKGLLDRVNSTGDWTNSRYTSNYSHFAFKVMTDTSVPTNPGEPQVNSVHNLTGEDISVTWTPSTEPNNNPIKYSIELYDGSSWREIASEFAEPNRTFSIPSGIHTSSAKVRVKATSLGSTEWIESQTFKISKQLLLIQDGDIIKTYKNGAWQTI